MLRDYEGGQKASAYEEDDFSLDGGYGDFYILTALRSLLCGDSLLVTPC